jgi:hypothetical protein
MSTEILVSGETMQVVVQDTDVQVVAVAEQGAAGAQGNTGATGAAGANGQGVPTGGSTGQLLTKTSGSDFATAWQNPDGQAILNTLTTQNNRLLARQSGLWTPLVYQDGGVQTLATTISWTGTTAPSGTAQHFYWWTRLDQMVQLWVVLNYENASTSTSRVQIAWPSDVPAPFEWTGLTAADSILYSGFCSVASAPNGSGATGRGYIRKHSSGTGCIAEGLFSSTTVRTVHLNFIYRTA